VKRVPKLWQINKFLLLNQNKLKMVVMGKIVYPMVAHALYGHLGVYVEHPEDRNLRLQFQVPQHQKIQMQKYQHYMPDPKPMEQ